ncbi:uncharacterized protein [Montipora capricornis]|uniref:uncharacterized protein n=1 Tax=Montipora capricornis TaxID=246305 RepID=UPI0035F1C210
MALRSNVCVYLFLGAFLPTFANCIRPFRVPKNLFVQGTSPYTLPEGIREIRREGYEPDVEGREAEEDLNLHHRFRRAVPTPEPAKSFQSLGNFDTLFMYWPVNNETENVIFLLGKKDAKSKVFVSRDYGKNFTDLDQLAPNGKAKRLIDHIYCSKADPKLCILADKKNKVIYHTEDLDNFHLKRVDFVPSYFAFHPRNARFAMAYDNANESLWWSNDKGSTFKFCVGNVKSFHWGVEDVHDNATIFVETFSADRATREHNRTTVNAFRDGILSNALFKEFELEEFEVMKNYMFVTFRLHENDANPTLKVARITPADPFPNFGIAQFPLNEESRDFFVFDVVDNFVFIVINHKKNLSNMYVSDTTGQKYQLSLPRVLYHNPYTDVSSPWLRTVIPYAFVDVDKVKGMRGIYVATQLTPGPVGKRHLLSLITYNRGATWQRIRSPTMDTRGGRIYCYLPTCSIHVNLLYGAVYRVSPSERLMSSEAAPGLVLTLGVASTNLKIYPDVFMSLDGGYEWQRVLRGKYRFAFGDHGGVIVAVPFRRYTKSLRYSIDGGASWKVFTFSDSSILAKEVVTQPGERLPVFLIYGHRDSSDPWKVFQINMTSVLGSVCDSSAYVTWSDTCLLGEQRLISTRNWTIHCHMGSEFRRVISTRKCACTKDDFQCDYGFERKDFDQGCTPIRQGVDLNHQIIPDNCTEGANYSRTQGFRKIEGDTCENGTEKDFLPVLTPCPANELYGLTLNCTTKDKGNCRVIPTNQAALFKAGIQKGYLPNIQFGWHYGDHHDETGPGMEYETRNHSYHEPGKFVVSLFASNTRSTLVRWLEINVREILDASRVAISFSPKIPQPNEPVIFSANLNYSSEEVGSAKYVWKYGGKVVTTTHPVATLRFKKAKKYTVDVTISNGIRPVNKTVEVKVFIDLTVVNVSVKVLGPASVEVYWRPPANAGSSTQYKVFQSTVGFGDYKGSSCEKTKVRLSCKISNLNSATTYYFKVRAEAGGDVGPFSDIAVATTNFTKPGMPAQLKAVAIDSNSMKVTWKAPQGSSGQTLTYKIRYWSQLNLTVQNVDNGNKLKYELGDLKQDTYYFFEVYAENAAGQGPFAGPIGALTKLSKPVLPPREIQPISNNGTCVVLTWKPPYVSSEDNRTFPAKGYKVFLNGNAKSVPSTHAIICSLRPGNSYNGTIVAFSKAGDGPSAPFSVSLQAMKPGVPQIVSVRVLSSKEVELVWKPAPADVSRITNYIIYQSPPIKEKTSIVSGDKTSYTVHNLKPYTKYLFQIAARNSLGISSRSPFIKASTLQESPGIVRYINAQAVDPKSASIKLTWSTPENPNGPIKGYVVKWTKSGVGVYEHVPDMQTLELPGSATAHLFKNLFSSTPYSFTVFARNDAGQGMQHVDPVTERTYPAPKGTQQLQLSFDGPEVRARTQFAQEFKEAFVQAASKKAGMLDTRIAGVDLKEINVVVFDLLPPHNGSGKSMEIVKAALNNGFKVNGRLLRAGSLSLLFVHNGEEDQRIPAADQSTPGAAAVVAKPPKNTASEISSSNTKLAIALPLVLIALALLFGMIFYYVKFRTLQKRFSNEDDKYPEDEMDEIIYRDDMQGDSPDVIFSDQTRKGKRIYKDSEKVPLGESDELAMI